MNASCALISRLKPSFVILSTPSINVNVCVINPNSPFPSPTVYLHTLTQRTQHFPTLSHSHTQRTENETERERHVEPPLPSSLPCLSLFIYCLQFFHRTHIDAEKAGCECVSESFPDEGDKVEVISRALMQYDSP